MKKFITVMMVVLICVMVVAFPVLGAYPAELTVTTDGVIGNTDTTLPYDDYMTLDNTVGTYNDYTLVIYDDLDIEIISHVVIDDVSQVINLTGKDYGDVTTIEWELIDSSDVVQYTDTFEVTSYESTVDIVTDTGEVVGIMGGLMDLFTVFPINMFLILGIAISIMAIIFRFIKRSKH